MSTFDIMIDIPSNFEAIRMTHACGASVNEHSVHLLKTLIVIESSH
jgi:hypothetical protein